MSNRYGCRVAYDRFDREWYAVDAHGSVLHGPFPTEAKGWAWVEEWTERRLNLAAGIGRMAPPEGPLFETGAEWLARHTPTSTGD